MPTWGYVVILVALGVGLAAVVPFDVWLANFGQIK